MPSFRGSRAGSSPRFDVAPDRVYSAPTSPPGRVSSCLAFPPLLVGTSCAAIASPRCVTASRQSSSAPLFLLAPQNLRFCGDPGCRNKLRCHRFAALRNRLAAKLKRSAVPPRPAKSPILRGPNVSVKRRLTAPLAPTSGISLLHLSWGRPRRTLSAILPCGARTFLTVSRATVRLAQWK